MLNTFMRRRRGVGLAIYDRKMLPATASYVIASRY
jgi:hypothetical protein